LATRELDGHFAEDMPLFLQIDLYGRFRAQQHACAEE